MQWFISPAALILPDSVPVLAFGLPNGFEWLVIGVVALLIFGKRLPGAARGVGEALREFKRGLKPGPDNAHQMASKGLQDSRS